MTQLYEWGRPIAPWAAEYVADRMRLSDELEVMASHHMHPKEAVEHAIEGASVALSIHAEDGEPIGICGVSPSDLIPRGGYVWLLGTDGLTATDNRRRLLVVEGRRWIDGLLADGHGPLFNWCKATNGAAIRWLTQLGFQVDQVPEPYGPSGQLFRYFWRER